MPIHTIINSSDETLTISESELLANCAALGIFDINEADRIILFSRSFCAHLSRTRRLIVALDTLSSNKESDAAQKEYLAARRDVEADLIYYKPELNIL